MVNLDDELLIDRLRSGDAAAIGDIVEKYHKHLCWQATYLLYEKHAAEDVVQDTLMKILQNDSLTQLTNSLALKKFLVVSVRRACVRVNQQYRQRLSQVDDMAARNEESIEIEYDNFLEQELKQKLEENLNSVLGGLPGKRREIIRMVYFEKLRIREIAERLGLTEGSARTYQKMAIKNLKERMLARK